MERAEGVSMGDISGTNSLRARRRRLRERVPGLGALESIMASVATMKTFSFSNAFGMFLGGNF